MAEKGPVDGNTIDSRARLGGADIEEVLRELLTIREDIVAAPAMSRLRLDAVHTNYRRSARNLLQYLALRRRDLRPLQLQLAAMGLSSLGRAESHVLATVDAVLEVVHRLAGHSRQEERQEEELDFSTGQRLLAEHTDALLGAATPGRGVRIMVTMPSEAADDYLLVHSLLEQGMNCMRINCAHDDAAAWLRMIEHLRRAERALNRSCRLVMDLAGPKLRTGPLEPGPAVARIRPRRDAYGGVTDPARVWLTRESSPPSPADASLPVPARWLSQLRIGTEVTFRDARGAQRTLTVVDVTDDGCWAEAMKTAYILPGTLLRHRSGSAGSNGCEARVGRLPPVENAILLRRGDLLILTRDLKPGRPATYDSGGQVLTPAVIGSTIPTVFDDVRSGESIWFDDGRIGGVVETVEPSRVLVRITHARLRGEKLRGDKGINLPESNLRLAALTPKDLDDLSFVAQQADIVELSFGNHPRDVESLHQHLAQLGSLPSS